MRRIEEFNICSSEFDFEAFTDPDFRKAVEIAVSRELKDYELLTGTLLEPRNLFLCFYRSAFVIVEIKDSLRTPSINLAVFLTD